MLAIALDREAQQPIYEQIKTQLQHQIEDGVLTAGDRLPPTRDLADELGVARISVVSAYDELKAEGYLSTQVGRGTFVADRAGLQPEPAAVSLAGTPRAHSSALRDLLRLAERPGVINFAQGTPADAFLPVDLIRQSLNAVLARDGAAAIAYEQPEGYQPLRQGVAQMVQQLGIDVPPDEVLITGGCQQALDLAIQALLSPGDVLLTSNPTYAGVLDIARARHVTPVGVPVDDSGLRTDLLEAMIIEQRPRLLYIAPTYHNPTGTVLSLARRHHILDLAARYRLPVLEDGVYEDLTYTGTPPPPLKALDEEGMVLYASSFSKVLLPGMRIGYLLAGGRLYRRVARVKAAADICTPALNQRAIHHALASGQLQAHIAQVRKACQIRRAAMFDALNRHFPEAHYREPAGGLYLWLALPADGPTATELYLQAVQQGVAFAMGPLFYVDGQGTYHLRLNMVAAPPETIDEGLQRLAHTWRELAADYDAPRAAASAPFV